MAADPSMQILVVADYQTTVCIVTNLLRQIGYAAIDVAASGAAALTKLRAKPYRLAIIDWSLDHAPGVEVLAEIRSKERFERLPAVMLAPQSQAAHVILTMKGACDHYLLKPFNAPTLQCKIDTALGGPRAAPDLAFTTSGGVLLPLA